MIDNEMYEYYKTKHEYMENHVIDHVVFNYFEMYIKMNIIGIEEINFH